ncbi:Prefoldin subunit-domain-containing protein [Cercophora samala]|uniref:Prefoldin subunit-domain-containing protein n=1 Tax=Cercophora samala TaxID=330535 RepID=A0AA40DFQ1_9PEZI|nr:Prefoldin subunit-domain-containing protein [Cercophora samala]
MASQPTETPLDRHIHSLSQKVSQLRASLAHWQQWYLEYSSLKEEISQLTTTPSSSSSSPSASPLESLRRIRRDFDGKVLTQKEIHEIMGKNDFRDVDKILGLLTHRIDYVEQNLESVGRMLEREENRLAAASVVADPDVPTDEESGLPIMDVIEMLDEEGNVVDFRLQSGGEAAGRVMEVLGRAGVGGMENGMEGGNGGEAAAVKAAEQPAQKKKPTPKAVERKPETKGSVTNGEASPVAKKTVSFTEDTKPGHPEGEKKVKSLVEQQLEEVLKMARESQSMDMSKAVIPEDESEEDAKLRREMLEYSMSEIGPVVAELTLEEGEFTDDEDWDMDDDDEEDEDEDDMGRSKHSVLSSDYIQRMQELEKKLGVKSAFSAPVEPTRTVPDEGMGRISVVKESTPKVAETNTPKEKAKAPKEKKSVSFATELDIAPTTTLSRPDAPAPAAPKINPVADIVEKVTDMTMEDDEEEEPPKRVSRFKKERATTTTGGLPPGPHQLPPTFIHTSSAPPPEPTPPEDSTLAPTVVERATPATAAEPDDMDDAMLYQAAAVEYNRMRNQLIQKQGGFIEDPPLNEEGLIANNNGPKKVSRFKQARLGKMQ